MGRYLTEILLGVLLVQGASEPGQAEDGFDFGHIDAAIGYLATQSDEALSRVNATAGSRHLKRHSYLTGYFPKGATESDINRSLLKPRDGQIELAVRTQKLLVAVRDNPIMQKQCVAEAAKYLPGDVGVGVPLYVTWGYDIGVASDRGASLNFTHHHFLDHPQEVWFYCTHESHHVGVIRLHGFPDLSAIRTVGQMRDLIRFLTFLEGTAVYAAYDIRAQMGGLEQDEDYVALQDPERMNAISRRYSEILLNFEARDAQDMLKKTDWDILDEMSGGERLWYRHGARMAQHIVELGGEKALKEAIEAGPDAFFAAFDTPVGSGG